MILVKWVRTVFLLKRNERFYKHPEFLLLWGVPRKPFLTKAHRVSVAVKIQYPGVSTSIDSDLNTLKKLAATLGILPKSFFLEDFVANARQELKQECDYLLEARKQLLYRELVKEFSTPEFFYVPRVVGRYLLHPNSRRARVQNGVCVRICKGNQH